MKSRTALSARQERILDFIISEVETKGYPPSVREIGHAVELKSSSTVHNHLNQLERKGYIRRDPTKPRAIMILKRSDESDYTTPAADPGVFEDIVDLPVYGKVAAGSPIFADENLEDRIGFPMRFVREEGAFMLRISGDSMIGVGIMDGDYIIIAPQQVAQNGEIVVALIGEEATCKTFYHEKNRVRLQPENPNLEPIYAENPMIIGKVVGVYRDLHKK